MPASRRNMVAQPLQCLLRRRAPKWCLGFVVLAMHIILSGAVDCLVPWMPLLARQIFIDQTDPADTGGVLLPPRQQVLDFIGPSHMPEIDHYLYGGRRDWTGQPFRALFLRGGGGEGSLMLASQLQALGGIYEVVHVDDDPGRLEQAKALHARWRGGQGRLSITYVQASARELLTAEKQHHGRYDYVDNSEAWRLDVSVLESLVLCRLLMRADAPAGLGLVLPTPAFAQLALSELRGAGEEGMAAARELLVSRSKAEEEEALRMVVERVCGSSKGLGKWSQGMRSSMAHAVRDTVLRPKGYSVPEVGVLLKKARLQLVDLVDHGLYQAHTFHTPSPPSSRGNSTGPSLALPVVVEEEELSCQQQFGGGGGDRWALLDCYAEGEMEFGGTLFHELFASSSSSSGLPDPPSFHYHPSAAPRLLPIVRNPAALHQLALAAGTTPSSSQAPAVEYLIRPELRPVSLAAVPLGLLHRLLMQLQGLPSSTPAAGGAGLASGAWSSGDSSRQHHDDDGGHRQEAAAEEEESLLRFLHGLGWVVLGQPLTAHALPAPPAPPLDPKPTTHGPPPPGPPAQLPAEGRSRGGKEESSAAAKAPRHHPTADKQQPANTVAQGGVKKEQQPPSSSSSSNHSSSSLLVLDPRQRVARALKALPPQAAHDLLPTSPQQQHQPTPSSWQQQQQQASSSFPQQQERLGRVPCSPPHCYFRCSPTQPPPAQCQPPPFDWASAVQPRTCHHPQLGGVFSLWPISFAVPSEDVVDCLPRKTKSVATVVPYVRSSYVFSPLDEAEYKRDYRNAHFGMTRKKAGWDCLRHYEILASGSVPLFTDLEHAPTDVMTSLPKSLLLEARRLPGVKADGSIDPHRFNQSAYEQVACRLLEYTRQYLTTEALAQYVLSATQHDNATSVLFLSYCQRGDYMRDLLLHGLHGLMARRGGVVVDVPRVEHQYLYPDDQPLFTADNNLYGHGFTYAHRLHESPGSVHRSDLLGRIRRREFDVVIYGSVHRGLVLWDEVMAAYPPSRVIYIDGEDDHGWDWVMEKTSFLLTRGHYFMREIPPGCPPLAAAA